MVKNLMVRENGAVKPLEESLAKHAERAEACRQLGEKCYRLGDKDSAIDWFRVALEEQNTCDRIRRQAMKYW